MPKRLCPFDTSCSPQLKTYLGEKEMTVKTSEGKAALSAIHTKTLQKLYEGAKTAKQQVPCTCGHLTTNQNKTTNIPTNHNSPEMILTNQDDHYKQLRLGNHGELIRESAQVKELNGSSVSPEVCTFCDVALSCQQCQRTCQQCHNVFCHNCCLNVFTGTGDTSLCISCVH